MPYGYLGQNTPNQTVSNSGVFSISDVASLEKQGKFGGSLELIEEVNITSATANISFTNIQETKFDVHYLTFNLLFDDAFGNEYLFYQLYESGVRETASVYQYAQQYGTASGSFGEQKSTGTALPLLSISAGQTTNELTCGYVYWYNLGNSSKYSFCTNHTVQYDNTAFLMNFSGSVLPQASTVDGIYLASGSGANIVQGNFKLYGVKQL